MLYGMDVYQCIKASDLLNFSQQNIISDQLSFYITSLVVILQPGEKNPVQLKVQLL